MGKESRMELKSEGCDRVCYSTAHSGGCMALGARLANR